MAEHVSELSPEQESPQQHLQKRFTAHGAVSQQLPNPVHSADRDLGAERTRGALTCKQTLQKHKTNAVFKLTWVE